MTQVQDLYEILGVPAAASPEEITGAFRRLALLNHPDTSGSRDTEARFILVHNAYATLSDTAKRFEYDQYRAVSSVYRRRGRASSASITGRTDILQSVLTHLNVILWDIEDCIGDADVMNRGFGGVKAEHYLLIILQFIDTWILNAAGFPDYFFQARNMDVPELYNVESSLRSESHRPFINLTDYFYNVRRRTDVFLNRTNLIDLLQPQPDTGVSLAECIVEAHNLGVHYLRSIREADTEHTVLPFAFSSGCFSQ